MAHTLSAASWPPILAIVALWAASSKAYLTDWSLLIGRPHEATCVDIPKNMSLCSDIGYDKMRLPNLLDHDTLTEVHHQSGSWVPLLNVKCHPHTKLFLCSLFTPVCLESHIFPCRSLCMSVQQECESRMRTYGFPWPEMFSCDKFPEDNDMCIKASEYEESLSQSKKQDGECSTCNPVDTYENILDNFCRADAVVIARIRRQKGRKVSLRRTKSYKGPAKGKGKGKKSRRGERRLLLEADSACCKFSPGKQKYLIMGKTAKKKFIHPTFVLPWKKSKSLRQALRMFRKLDCEDPNLFTPTSEDGTIIPQVEPTNVPGRRGGRKGRRRKNGKKSDNGTVSSRRKNRKMRRRKNEEKQTKSNSTGE